MSDGWARAIGPMQFLSTTFPAWPCSPQGAPGAEPDPHNAWAMTAETSAWLRL
jgi:hypothetical protein